MEKRVQVANGGVGMIISKEASRSLINLRRITNRIMLANYQSNPLTTMSVIYVNMQRKK